jgi:hypothetical protein
MPDKQFKYTGRNRREDRRDKSHVTLGVVLLLVITSEVVGVLYVHFDAKATFFYFFDRVLGYMTKISYSLPRGRSD